MTTNNTLSVNITMKRLQLIREYVALQEKLVSAAVSKLSPGASEYDFEESLAAKTTIDDGTTWLAKAHGLGVMFTNPKSRTVVDAHIGFIDAPNVFDAWRLVQYCESTQRTNEDLKSWQETLEELTRNGTIEPHRRHERHYVMK